MPRIASAMQDLGAKDFEYIDVHLKADNPNDGHGAGFLRALEGEQITDTQMNRGLGVYTRLFESMFVI